MNPFVLQLVNAAARAAVIWIGAKLGSNITDNDAGRIVVEYLVPVAMLLWSFWQKYTAQQKLVTALATPSKMSERQLENLIRDSQSVPSVSTVKQEVPS